MGTPPTTAATPSTARTTDTAGTDRAPSRARRSLFAALALLLPCVAALLLEGGLRAAGVGQSHPLFVPVADAPEYLRVNGAVMRRFMVDPARTPNLSIWPVYFERRKSPRTFRIFVQGGSTAAGWPYGYGASPAGMLRQRLQRTFPERRIEVVTTAVSAVNSYTLLDFSAEILEQEPDAVVIYAGHNEYLGILGVGSGYSVGRWRPVVLAFLRLDASRIFQLAQRAFTSLGAHDNARPQRTLMARIAAEEQIPYGSALYRRGLEQYRANLRALLMRYRRAGVPVFLGTVVANERDQPPFAGVHGRGADVAAWEREMESGRSALEEGDAAAARAAFDAAVAIDELHAGGHFALARALDELGHHGAARRAYLAAKDRDALRFRAPEELNEILREVAAEEGAQVVEVAATFHRAARDGIVGHDLMLEHLHPNLDGYFLLADAFYEALRGAELIGPGSPVPRDVARREIPITEVDRLYGELRIEELTSDWPFEQHRQELRLTAASNRVEEIAQSYFRGRYAWPAAMRSLLHHYRRSGDLDGAAHVAALVAYSFPNRLDDQLIAAELLERAGHPGADFYRRRAEEAASRKGARP